MPHGQPSSAPRRPPNFRPNVDVRLLTMEELNALTQAAAHEMDIQALGIAAPTEDAEDTPEQQLEPPDPGDNPDFHTSEG